MVVHPVAVRHLLIGPGGDQNPVASFDDGRILHAPIRRARPRHNSMGGLARDALAREIVRKAAGWVLRAGYCQGKQTEPEPHTACTSWRGGAASSPSSARKRAISARSRRANRNVSAECMIRVAPKLAHRISCSMLSQKWIP